MKWDYLTAYCFYADPCKQCKDERGNPRSHWVLNTGDNKHHELEDGLKQLGAEGWELVATQRADTYIGSPSSHHWFIFKKSLLG